MPDQYDDYENINITVQAPLVYENFLTGGYTETDGGNDLTLTDHKINIDTMAPSVISSVQRAGVFNNFTLVMKLGITQMDIGPEDSYGGLVAMLFSVNQASHTMLTASSNTDGFVFYVREYTVSAVPPDPALTYVDVFIRQYMGAVGTNPTFKEWSGVMPWTQWPITNPATPRWVQIIRTGASVSCNVYADEGLTQKLNPGTRLQNLVLPDARQFNYFSAVCSRGPGSPTSLYFSGYAENYQFLP